MTLLWRPDSLLSGDLNLFSVESRIDENILLVSIAGYCEKEAGSRIFAAVKQAIENQSLKGVILEFGQCSSINSSCIATLMETAELVTYDFKSYVVVCNLDQTKASFFKMFGLLDLAELQPDIDSAKKYLRA